MSKAWLVLTDLSPCEASAVWYWHRSWVEQGFRDLNGRGSGGSCAGEVVGEASLCGERVSVGLVIGVVGGFGVCGGFALWLVS